MKINKDKLIKKKKLGGYSMVELLVVLLIFAVVGYLVTISLALTLQGTRKSESLVKVREEINYVTNIMERLIRNATELDCSASSPTQLVYADQYRNQASFTCDNTINAIASGSARITSSDVYVDCSGTVFTCNAASGGVPPSVDINIVAESSDTQGTKEAGQITSSTKILLRTY